MRSAWTFLGFIAVIIGLGIVFAGNMVSNSEMNFGSENFQVVNLHTLYIGIVLILAGIAMILMGLPHDLAVKREEEPELELEPESKFESESE